MSLRDRAELRLVIALFWFLIGGIGVVIEPASAETVWCSGKPERASMHVVGLTENVAVPDLAVEIQPAFHARIGERFHFLLSEFMFQCGPTRSDVIRWHQQI